MTIKFDFGAIVSGVINGLFVIIIATTSHAPEWVAPVAGFMTMVITTDIIMMSRKSGEDK